MVYKPSSMILAAIVAIGLGATAQAGILQVAGSPEYDPATQTGLKDGEIPYAPGWGANNSGTAVGRSIKYDNGIDLGLRAVRWDASGTAATELGYLGLSTSNSTAALALAVNDAGTAVGRSKKYDVGVDKGYRAVRWDAAGTIATELGNLGTINGSTNAEAYAVNASGTAVGSAKLYVSNADKGIRAVRWDASGVPTELPNLGLTTSASKAYAFAINDDGIAVGYSQKPGGLSNLGTRAVRWNSSGVVAELGNLGTTGGPYPTTNAHAVAVNAVGTAVGWATKYVSGSLVGDRAVRWDASGTIATELDNLGLSGSNSANTSAYAVNDANTAVGYAQKFDSGIDKGTRAIRWDGSGTAATELGNLGLDANNSTSASAYAVNGAGTAVGYAQKYDLSGIYVGDRAVIWLPDASAIDLNDLGVVPVPAGGAWTLTTARALSAYGWVAGSGAFDPDGDGPQASYTRHWVAQVGLGGTWTNAAGGTWGRGPNWSTGTPAMQVGNATFDRNSAYTVALDRNELTQTIAINAGTVTINFNGHTLTTENGLSIADGATLKVDGTIVSDIINAGTLGGTGIISGPVILTGDSTLISTGTLTISNTLTISGDANQLPSGTILTSGNVTINPGAVFIINGTLGGDTGTLIVRGTLMGKGTIGKGVSIEAGGTFSPGSPSSIKSLSQVLGAEAPRNFSFEIGGPSPNYAAPQSSVNDVLRLTSETLPFANAAGDAPTGLTADTVIDVYFIFNDPPGGEYKAEFFAETDYSEAVADATFQYWRLDPRGERLHNSNFFSPLDGSLVDWSVVPETATFGGVEASGYITAFTVVPEPATLSLLALGGLALLRRGRRK
jgi:hypothetical protein